MTMWWQQLQDVALAHATTDELATIVAALRAEADRLGPPPDRAAWVRRWLPDSFPLPWGPHHLRLLSSIGPHPVGRRVFVAAPRGSGKTTVSFRALPVAALAAGSHQFVVIVAANQHQANRRLELLRSLLRPGSAITAAYPQLLPMSDHRGRPALDQASEIWLRAGRVVALGAGAPFRGLVRAGPDGSVVRPDLLVFDDIEVEEQVRSKVRTDRLEEWLLAEVGQLGGAATAPLDILGIGTTLGPDALAVRILEGRGRFAGWERARYPAEGRVAEVEGRRIVADLHGRRIPMDPPPDAPPGTRIALWEGQPLSYLDRLTTPGDPLYIGPVTYAREYLLDPQTDADQPIRDIVYGTPPDSFRRIVIGVDPAVSLSETADRSAIVVVGVDGRDGETLWVLDEWADRVTMSELFDRIAQIAHSRGAEVAYEAAGAFAWGEQELRARHVPHHGYRPGADGYVGDKLSRLRRVSLLYDAGQVRHAHWLSGGELEHELLGFGAAPHDDLVDALVLAIHHLTRTAPPAAAAVDDWEGDPYAAERRSRLF